MKRVYLDMDNVLVDFASGIAKIDEAGGIRRSPGGVRIAALMDPIPGAINFVHLWLRI